MPAAGASIDDDLPLGRALDRVLPPESGVASAAVERDEPSPRAVMKYASAYARYLDGNLSGAKSDALEALILDPKSIESLALLGRIEKRQGLPLNARYYFERAHELDPGNAEAVTALSRDALSLGDHDRAMSLIAPWARGERDDSWFGPVFMDRAARVLAERGYISAAAEAVERIQPPESVIPEWARDDVIEVFRAKPMLWIALGDRAAAAGDDALALGMYDNAERDAGGYVPMLDTHRVYALVVAGRQRDADELVIRRIEMTRAADLETRALVRYLAQHGGSRERLTNAIATVARSAERRGEASGASLVRLAASAQPPDEAIETLTRHLSDHPGDTASMALVIELAAKSRGPAAAWAVAVGMVESSPWRGDRVAEFVVDAVDDRKEIISLSNDESSPASTFLSGLVRWRVGQERAAHRLLAMCAEDPALDGAAIEPAARLAFMLGRLDEAMAIIESAGDRGTEGVERGKAGALAALTLRDRAIETIEPWLENDPDAQTLYLAGRLYRGRGDHARAARLFEQAWRRDPHAHRAAAALMRIIGPGGAAPDEQRASATVREMRRVDPTGPVLGWYRVQAQVADDQRELAMNELRLLIEENPGEEAFVVALAESLVAEGRGREAMAWLEREASSHPGSAERSLALARVRIAVGEYDLAADTLEDWLKRFPGDYEASRLLELVYRDHLSLRLTSEEFTEKRLELMPRTVETVLEDLSLHVSKKRFVDASVLLDELMEIEPEPTQRVSAGVRVIAEELITRSTMSDAQITDALALLEKMRERFATGVSPEFLGLELMLVGRSTLTAGELLEIARRAEATGVMAAGEATVMLADSVREPRQPFKNRREFNERRQRALDLLRMSATGAGERSAAVSAEWFHRSMEVGDFLMMGDALEHIEREGLLGEVLGYLVESGENAPFGGTWENAMRWSVGAMNQVGRERAADVAYEGVLYFAPDDPSACNDLGYRLLERGEQIPRAVALIETAYRQNSDDPATVDSMGWARYMQGHFEDATDPETGVVTPGAITHLERSLELLGDRTDENAVFNIVITKDHLGDAYWASGDRESAALYWRESVALAEKLIVSLRSQEFGDAAVAELGAIIEQTRGKTVAVDAGREPEIAPVYGETVDPATIPPPSPALGPTGEQASGRT